MIFSTVRLRNSSEMSYKRETLMNLISNHAMLSKIVINGFISIAECRLDLGALNIMIGCNGAGKSNFIGFFKMVRAMLEGNLQLFVSRRGGPDAILHFGRKTTGQLSAELYFDNHGYKFSLEPTHDNRLTFSRESVWENANGDRPINSGHFESEVERLEGNTSFHNDIVPAMKNWRVHHFQDTGETALLKQLRSVNDNEILRSDGRNLAAYLYLLKNRHSANYNRIVKTVRLAAPFFNDFHLRPSPHNPDMIELEWTEKGRREPFKCHHLSDGAIRFICLATVFLQPKEKQPATILVDEPELGLHPYAIKVLASLMKTAALEKQIIVSTQSVELLDEFEPADIVVVDRGKGRSVFRRLRENELTDWLEDYSLGELWKKNLFGGRPAR